MDPIASVTVQIAQRKTGEPAQATFSANGMAGNLLSEWQPGVSDYAATVLSASPVGYWRLGESGGTVAADSSGNGLTGTYHGTPGTNYTLNLGGPLAADSDTSVNFAGGYVSGGGLPTNTAGASVSIACWINPSSFTTGTIFVKGSAGVSWGYGLGINSSGHITVANTNNAYDTGAAVPLNQWSFVVAVYTSSGVTVYVNGTATGSTSQVSTPDSTDTWSIGAWPNGAWSFTGMIDEVAVYNTALQSAQISAQWNAGHAATLPKWSYGYDNSGNETSQTDPMGNVTSWTYDEFGHQLSRTLPGGQQEGWQYDAHGRMLAHSDFDGNQTVYTYDDSAAGDGRLLGEYRYVQSNSPTSPVPFVVPQGFDPTNPGNSGTSYANYVYAESTTYQYDTLSRQTEVDDYVWGNSTPTEYVRTGYDPVTGNASSITTALGTINYTYDPATGREVRAYTSTGLDDTAYAYDAQGRLADVYALVLNGTVHGTFAGISNNSAAFTGSPLITAYTYDGAGNLKTETLPDGVQTTYDYDLLNRLTDLTSVNTATSKSVFAEHYDLRSDGTRQDVIDTRYNAADGNIFSKVQMNWASDALDRLTSESETILDDGTGGTTNTNGHAPAPYRDEFAFDLDGNRVSEGISGSENAGVAYTYNPNNQLLTETRGGDGAYQILYGHVDSNGVFHPGYDANGNLIEQHRTGTNPEDDSYTWDLRDRMVKVVSSVGGTTNYTYDPNGVLVKEVTPTATTAYLNDPQNPTGYSKAVEAATTTASGTVNRSYVLALTVVGQSDQTNGTLYLLHDGHGSTRDLLDGSAAVVEQYNYRAFGDLLASTGAQPNASAAKTVWLFAGDGEYDPSSGWNYNIARWRDGFRFTSMDDPSFAGPGRLGNANLYVYVGGNPINLTDPTGHDGLADTLVSMGIESMFQGLQLAVPLRAFGFAKDVISGASLAAATENAVVGLLEDSALSFGFGAALGFLKFAQPLMQLRQVGGAFTRLAESVWNLAPFQRGLAIERMILGRLPSPSSVSNFPVIDDFVQGVATSIKSLDLTAATYQNTSALVGRLSSYARSLSGFTGAIKGGLTVAGSAIKERVLLVAVEDGAATGPQWQALTDFQKNAMAQWPNIKVVFQFIK